MKLQLKIGFIIVLGSLLSTCKKKNNDQSSTNNNGIAPSTSNISNFFKNNGVSTQYFTIYAGSDQYITGSSGTNFYILAGSFLDQSNNIVSGNVTIELREVLTKKEMILTGMFPVSGHNLLISGGEVYFNAKQNGQQLKLSGNQKVGIGIPVAGSPSYQMKEFYMDSLSVNDTLGWIPNGDNVTVYNDSIGGTGYHYSFYLDNLQWINSDHFSGYSQLTSITLNVGSQFNQTNCLVFVSIDGESALGNLSYDGSKFSSGGSYWPIGKAVTFIVISEINGQYYSVSKSTTLVNNHIENLVLSATTKSAIDLQLSSLP